MMSVEHKKEVRNYLLSKKLPLNILIEVEDHFLSHIDILMSKTTSFEKSFDEVKQAWKEDLTLTKNFGKEIPVFVKDIKDKAMIRIFWKSLFVFLVMNGSVLVLSKVLGKETFREIFPFLISILTFIPSILFLWHIRYFNYVGRFKKIKFNIFQSSNAIIILAGAFHPFLLGQYGKAGAQMYEWLEQGSLIGFLSLIIFSGFVGLYSYGFFIMLGFVKSMKKMKPYLKTFNL